MMTEIRMAMLATFTDRAVWFLSNAMHLHRKGLPFKCQTETVQKVYVKFYSPPSTYKTCTSIRPPPFPFHYSTYHWTLVSIHESVLARQRTCTYV